MYFDSTDTLESYKWILLCGGSRRRFIWSCPRFEIWADRNKTYELTLCIWKLYLRFETGPDKNKWYPRFEIENDQNRWMIYDRCKSLSLTQCTRSKEFNVFVCELVYVWYEHCKDLIMIMWCMRWIMKA